MSEQRQSPSSSSDGGTDTGAVPTARWAPHGRALMGCLVAVNVGLVFLVYLYFWRVFSRKRAGPSSAAGGDEDEGEDEHDASSSASTPPADVSPGTNHGVVASLPVFVHSGAGVEKSAAAECAVCIAEVRDGDEMRAMPRCGHRFHAACVDVWLRLHTTCPLCRSSVAVPVQPRAEAEPGPGGGVPDATDALA